MNNVRLGPGRPEDLYPVVIFRPQRGRKRGVEDGMDYCVKNSV
jgi:hypothetical protein